MTWERFGSELALGRGELARRDRHETVEVPPEADTRWQSPILGKPLSTGEEQMGTALGQDPRGTAARRNCR